MKRLLTVLALGTTILAAGVSSRGEERPHLKFVRALRTKNYTDLALDYLDFLAKEGPKSVKPFIPLEKARVRMDIARNEPNMARRTTLYKQAREEFDSFAKNNPRNPLASEAQLESARILAMEGRSMMKTGQALPPGAQKVNAEKALKQFKVARQSLETAQQAIEKNLATAPPNLKAALTKAGHTASLELARNKLDIASTYEPRNKSLEERGKIITNAIEDLRALAAVDPQDPVCFQARAWVGKAYLDIDSPNAAEKEFKATLEMQGRHTRDGQRLVQYFQFEVAIDPLRAKDPAAIQKLGETWLRLYPNYHNTPEGYLLRYGLANTLYAKAKTMHKTPAIPAAAKTIYDKALSLYRTLEDPENIYSEEARKNKVKIMLLVTRVGDIDKIDDFGKAFIAAQGQAQKMGDAETKMWQLSYLKNPTPKQKAERDRLKKNWPADRKQYLVIIRDLYNRARLLADVDTPSKDLAEAYSNLSYVYMALGQPEKAVVIGEYVSRQMPHIKQSAAGAAYAIQAYTTMINQSRGALDRKIVKTDEDRLLRLARYMERTWPNDVNTDAARHTVGTMMFAQRRAKEAVAVLSRVSPTYKPASSLAAARWWWAKAAQQMLNENIPGKEKEFYRAQVLKALNGFPELKKNAGAMEAELYIFAKLMQGSTLFEQEQFDELDRLTTNLQTKFDEFVNLSPTKRKQLKPAVESMVAYGLYGRANNLLKAGQAKKASALLVTPVSDLGAKLAKSQGQIDKLQVKYNEYVTLQKNEALDDKQKVEMEKVKQQLDALIRVSSQESALMRALISVALRANVQTGNIAAAKSLLTRLRQAADDSLGAQVYVYLVAQVKKQIDGLKESNNKAQLDSLMANFIAFLQQLEKEDLKAEVVFFVANAYKQLERYKQAGNVLKKLEDPKDPGKGAKKDEKKAFKTAQNAYRAAQIMRVELYRMAKEFRLAEEQLKLVEKASWGKGMQVMRERAFFYQDQGKWGGAAVSWRNIMERLAPQIDQPKIREKYYDGYYNYIDCLYHYALDYNNPKLKPDENKKKKIDYIFRAARLILKVESAEPENMGGPGLKEKYKKLLSDHPELKQAYDKKKQEAPPAGDG